MLKKIRNYLPFIILIIAGSLSLTDLFREGLPLTHDGQDHVARIANFYTSLSEGILIPRWGGNLNWGFGHPVLMFLYPLPSYIASVFIFTGFSYVDSVKIVFGLSLLISGIGMYLWVSRLLGVYAGLISALLYMFAPYRFVNLYVRGAIGEHVAFAFIPFVLFFVTRLFLDSHTKKSTVLNVLGSAIFSAFLILSHNALSIIFLGVVIAYTLILFSIKKEVKTLIFAFVSIIYGFCLSAFFLVPAFLEGKYTLRDIVTGGGEYAGRFVPSPADFLIPSWSYGITGDFSVQIGIVHFSLILLGVFTFFRLSSKKKLEKRLFVLMFVLFLISLFMMLKESNFIWTIITLLQKFQFPWRFLSLTVLASSVLGAYFAVIITKKNRGAFAVFFVFILVLLFYSQYWRANGYLIKEQSFYSSIYNSTTDTGESSPIWSIRFMEQRPQSSIEILSGEADIAEIERKSYVHKYKVNAFEQSLIKENTLYFPGWNVYVNGKKLDLNEIEFQNEQHRGVMTFKVPQGETEVKIVFEDTKLRTFSNIISAVSLVLLAVVGFIYLRKNK